MTIVALLIGFGVSVEARAAFIDVPSWHPNRAAIDYVQSKGIVEGYTDGSYKPEQRINRAEFLKIIMESHRGGGVFMAEEEEPEDMADLLNHCSRYFSDLDVKSWYAYYVCGAVALRIVSGDPQGTFRPEEPINFAEAAKILIETFRLENQATCRWPKVPTPWYRYYIEDMRTFGFVPDSVADAAQYITRGEMAEMIYRIRNNDPNATMSFQEMNEDISRCVDLQFIAETLLNYIGDHGGTMPGTIPTTETEICRESTKDCTGYMDLSFLLREIDPEMAHKSGTRTYLYKIYEDFWLREEDKGTGYTIRNDGGHSFTLRAKNAQTFTIEFSVALPGYDSNSSRTSIDQTEWKSYRKKGYLIPIPSSWYATAFPDQSYPTENVYFTNSDGQIVAKLLSPIDFTGYSPSQFEVTNKLLFENTNVRQEATMWEGNPTTIFLHYDDLENYRTGAYRVYTDPIQRYLDNPDSGFKVTYSCQLVDMVGTAESKALFNTIFKGIQVDH